MDLRRGLRHTFACCSSLAGVLNLLAVQAVSRCLGRCRKNLPVCGPNRMDTPPLQSAYESYLSTRDDAALLSAIETHGGYPPPEGVDVPLVHRINDIQLDGKWFRIVRVVSLPTGNTDLLIYPADCGSDNPGVPYSLTGEKLLRWVHDELNSEGDDWDTWPATDWSKYLDTD